MTTYGNEDLPFHDVGKLFPGETVVLSVPPDISVTEALALMLERRYSQLPVVDGGNVRGVFTLWALAHQVADSPTVRIDNLRVEDVMEPLPSITIETSLESVLELLEEHEAVLVASPHGLQAIATSSDVLRYLYKVARPYVLLQEIELALRALIQSSATGEVLRQCIDRSLSKLRETGKISYDVAELTFEDYRSIVGAKDNWPLFRPALGNSRELVLSKLEKTRRIRNDVFHFRGEVSVLDRTSRAPSPHSGRS